ncbi:MAG: ISKra4 family transposase, partial [Pyrinomonadaceae bacterium]
AEEELFRRVGQEAAKEVLVSRWQAADKVRELQCAVCAERLKPLGAKQKSLRTLCGAMTVKRQVYYCGQCQRTEAPLDQRLGVEASGITPGLMRVICRSALELAYEQSQRLLSDTLGFSPCSAREVERIAKRHGGRIERLAGEQPGGAAGALKKSNKPRYITAIDAAMIPGLPDPETHCLAWHDVKLAVVFDARQLASSSYVAGREPVTAFSDRFWQHLQSRDLDERDFRLALGDGADWIWNLVEMHLPAVPQLLDFYHAAEHLYATAQSLWPASTAGTWWHRRLQQLKEGELSNFFAALKWLARSRSGSFKGEPELSPEHLLHYFLKNKERLNYRWALEENLPIGSGSVESAARHIVQQRLKQAGMRWSDTGAQAILNLRTMHRNGKFEQYWENLQAVGF